MSLLSWTDKVSIAAVFNCSLIAAIAAMIRCSYENHVNLAYLYAALFRTMTWVTPERALPFKLWIQCEEVTVSYNIHQLMYMSTSSLVEQDASAQLAAVPIYYATAVYIKQRACTENAMTNQHQCLRATSLVRGLGGISVMDHH